MTDLLSPGQWMAVLLGLAACFMALPGLVSLIHNRRDARELDRRLLGRQDAVTGEVPGASDSFASAINAVALRLAPAAGKQVSAVRARLNAAGYTASSAVAVYFLTRFACLILPQLFLFLLLPYLGSLSSLWLLVICLVLALAGLAAPGFFLDQKTARRRQAASAGFPDMMDLMVACVEAGLSLDAAVQRVGEELELRHPIIAVHLKTLSLELRAGKTRRTAWRAFADRMGIEEAGSLSTMLRQAEEMGTSLGQTLRVFSADMRQRRILRAEEKAMALPAKMTLPLILFVFPVLLGVLTLPAVVMLGKTLG